MRINLKPSAEGLRCDRVGGALSTAITMRVELDSCVVATTKTVVCIGGGDADGEADQGSRVHICCRTRSADARALREATCLWDTSIS